MKFEIIYLIAALLFFAIIVGCSRANKKIDIEATKTISNGIGIYCIVSQLILMFCPYEKGKITEVLIYSMVIVVLMVSIIIFLKEGAVTKLKWNL